jgi:hypothetical protein
MHSKYDTGKSTSKNLMWETWSAMVLQEQIFMVMKNYIVEQL